MPPFPLLLASTSRYRSELLSRLRLPFECAAPGTDETRLPHEPAAAMSARLALGKATDVARRRPDAVVIGSDQIAERNGQILGKPGSIDTVILPRIHGHSVKQLLPVRTLQD